MREGWEIKSLGEICDILDNKRKPITKNLRIEGDIPYYGATGILSYVKDYIFNEQLVLLGEDGAKWESGEKSAFIIKGKTWVNNHAHVLKPNKEILVDNWLVYNLNFQNLMPYVSGMTVPKLNQGNMRNIQVPIPPLQEQQQIVAILDQAFEAIDQAKANIEKNIANAKELYENWVQELFEKPKKNLKNKKLGDLCNFVRGPFGGSLKKSMFKQEGYVVYEQKHAIHNHFNQLRYFIDEEKFNEMKRFEVKPGDIIMSCSGVTLGRVAIIPENIPRGIINQALLKLTPNKDVSVEFLKYWLRSNIFQNIIFEYAGGAAIPNVPSAKILKEIIIPFPNIEEQLKIVSTIESMLDKTKFLEQSYIKKRNDLEDLKKSILQKAFAGELTNIKVA